MLQPELRSSPATFHSARAGNGRAQRGKSEHFLNSEPHKTEANNPTTTSFLPPVPRALPHSPLSEVPYFPPRLFSTPTLLFWCFTTLSLTQAVSYTTTSYWLRCICGCQWPLQPLRRKRSIVNGNHVTARTRPGRHHIQPGGPAPPQSLKTSEGM